MRFTPEFIDKVRDANDLVEIIGQHTELKGSHRLMGRCPFPDHSDKSPSFSVSADQQLYFCYGCKKGGNVFTFLETYNGMAFPEAVEYLARRASIPMPEPEGPAAKRPQGPTRDQKDLLLKVNRVAAVFFHQQLKALPEDHAAKKYLVKRGLSDETVEKFRLGVALDEWQGLTDHLKSRKVPMAFAEQLGLIKPRKAQANSVRKDDSYFDLFRDRLMFPIFSATSDVIGFGGRVLQPDALPKYVNSSDSPVFNKGRVLYGIHETGKYIRALDSAIVVEGYMDAIALYTAGIKNVVAILGTAFTPEHAKVLKRYSLNVTMLLDGDEAGLNGAERSLPILLEAGLMPKGLAIPDKMDPDEFVKAHGPERLQEEVGRAPELFNLLLTQRWMQGYHGSASEKVRIAEEAANSLVRMENRQLMDLYLLELARQLDVDVAWARKAVLSAGGPQAGRPTPNAAVPGVKAAAPQPAATSTAQPPPAEEIMERVRLKDAPKDEGFILSLLVNYEGLMRDLIEAGPDELLGLFGHSGVRRALELAIRRFQTQPDDFAGLAAFMASQVDQPAVLLSSMAALSGEEPEGFERQLMGDYLNAIRKRSLKVQLKNLQGQMKNSANSEQLEQKLEEFMNLQRDRLTLSKDTR